MDPSPSSCYTFDYAINPPLNIESIPWIVTQPVYVEFASTSDAIESIPWIVTQHATLDSPFHYHRIFSKPMH